MKDIVMELVANPYLLGALTGAVIFAITQILKMPIKHFTNKIKNERLRRIVNTTIMFIPFLLGVTAELLYTFYLFHDAYSVADGLGYGTISVSLYGFVERFLKVKLPSPYETEEGKAVLELIETVGSDDKIDEKDNDAIKAFWDKINK